MGKRTPIGVIGNVLRQSRYYKNWVHQIFWRDKFKCTECGYKSKENHDIEAHHINAFENILRIFIKENSKYDPIRDKDILVGLAWAHEPFWDLDNGTTLCKKCHDKLDNKGITVEI